VNPYAKIAVKIGVVIVICLVLLLAYFMIGHRTYMRAKRKWMRDKATQEKVEEQVNKLLQYNSDLPNIRQVQYQDMQMIRNLIPDADEFVLTTYLRKIHEILAENHLETDGIAIGGSRAAPAGASFDEAFSSDITALQKDLDKIVEALDWFRNNKDQMNNMIVSFQFYEKLSTKAENFKVIAGGIEAHTFSMTVRGSYMDIKKFTYEIFNMRPHTALVNFQMAPQGTGFGQTRQYSASFNLYTYGDANTPPPLWLALNKRVADSGETGAEEGAEEAKTVESQPGPQGGQQ